MIVICIRKEEEIMTEEIVAKIIEEIMVDITVEKKIVGEKSI